MPFCYVRQIRADQAIMQYGIEPTPVNFRGAVNLPSQNDRKAPAAHPWRARKFAGRIESKDGKWALLSPPPLLRWRHAQSRKKQHDRIASAGMANQSETQGVKFVNFPDMKMGNRSLTYRRRISPVFIFLVGRSFSVVVGGGGESDNGGCLAIAPFRRFVKTGRCHREVLRKNTRMSTI